MSSETVIESAENNLQLAYPWIDCNLFEELLRQDFPASDIVIHDYCLRAALASGENYASQMIRAEVNYSVNNSVCKQIKFIIKAAIPQEDGTLSYEMRGVFDVEILMYDEVLNKVYDLVKAIGVENPFYGRSGDGIGLRVFVVYLKSFTDVTLSIKKGRT